MVSPNCLDRILIGWIVLVASALVGTLGAGGAYAYGYYQANRGAIARAAIEGSAQSTQIFDRNGKPIDAQARHGENIADPSQRGSGGGRKGGGGRKNRWTNEWNRGPGGRRRFRPRRGRRQGQPREVSHGLP